MSGILGAGAGYDVCYAGGQRAPRIAVRTAPFIFKVRVLARVANDTGPLASRTDFFRTSSHRLFVQQAQDLSSVN
jgi:hypothetical protein